MTRCLFHRFGPRFCWLADTERCRSERGGLPRERAGVLHHWRVPAGERRRCDAHHLTIKSFIRPTQARRSRPSPLHSRSLTRGHLALLILRCPPLTPPPRNARRRTPPVPSQAWPSDAAAAPPPRGSAAPQTGRTRSQPRPQRSRAAQRTTRAILAWSPLAPLPPSRTPSGQQPTPISASHLSLCGSEIRGTRVAAYVWVA